MPKHQPASSRWTALSRAEPDIAVVSRQIAAIYAELATIPVQRRCELRTECCQFHLTGRVPYLTRAEALYMAVAVRAAGWKNLPDTGEEASCPLLKHDGKCRVYANRPFGCRTHFCEAAGGPYGREEVLALIHKLEELDAELGGRGTETMGVALSRALKDISIQKIGRSRAD